MHIALLLTLMQAKKKHTEKCDVIFQLPFQTLVFPHLNPFLLTYFFPYFNNVSRVFKLRSSDNETFQVEEAAALLSKTIKSSTSTEITVPYVKAEILGKVVDWCNKHAVSEGTKDQLIKEWDAEFLSVDQDVLFKLITAADYLQIKELVDQLSPRVGA
ncbi:hypothetical protein ACLB2K_032890 [Fragaria x ananassa]